MLTFDEALAIYLKGMSNKLIITCVKENDEYYIFFVGLKGEVGDKILAKHHVKTHIGPHYVNGKKTYPLYCSSVKAVNKFDGSIKSFVLYMPEDYEICDKARDVDITGKPGCA